MIPESNWVHETGTEWSIKRTRVGDVVISTVALPSDWMGYNYETAVFEWSGELHEDGSSKITNWLEIDVERYNDACAAADGHTAMCRKYAGMEAAL